jgi:uncharacterized membrane protein YfcA
MDVLLLAPLFGVAIGLLLGTIGGGGSILTVPILVYLLGEDVHEATATSLVIVGLTALVGAVPHARAGRVAPATALLFGGAGIGGAFVGAALNARVSGPVILLLFGLLMLVVAARLAFGRRPKERSRAKPEGAPGASRWAVGASGLGVGMLTGFFGVGGGFLIVPALVLVLGLPMGLAVGTSLLIIGINAGAGVVAHLGSGGIDLPLALLFVAGGFAGAALGGSMAGSIDERRLSRAFAGFVALVGVYLVVRNGVALA